MLIAYCHSDSQLPIQTIQRVHKLAFGWNACVRSSGKLRKGGARTVGSGHRLHGTICPSSFHQIVLATPLGKATSGVLRVSKLTAPEGTARHVLLNTTTPLVVETGSGERPARAVVMDGVIAVGIVLPTGGRIETTVAMRQVRDQGRGTRTNDHGRTGGREIGSRTRAGSRCSG